MKKGCMFILLIVLILLAFIAIITILAVNDAKEEEAEGQPWSVVDMETAFKSIGLNDDEIKTTKEIFTNLGITQISMPTEMAGDGLDILQSYKAYAFGYKNATVIFTFDKRRLCYVSYYSTDMYDMLDDATGEYDSNKNGYLRKYYPDENAIRDYE